MYMVALALLSSMVIAFWVTNKQGGNGIVCVCPGKLGGERKGMQGG